MVDPSSVHVTVVPSTRMPYRKTLASLPAEGSDLLCMGDFSAIPWPEHQRGNIKGCHVLEKSAMSFQNFYLQPSYREKDLE